MGDSVVAFTDLLFGIENIVFALTLGKLTSPQKAYRTWSLVFYASTAASSIMGALSHSLFYDQPFGLNVIWPGTMLFIGITTLSVWQKGAVLLGRSGAAGPVRWFSWVQLVVFTGFVLAGTREFFVVIMNYFPPLVLLQMLMVIRAIRGGGPSAVWGSAGGILIFAASAVQALGFSLHPVYAGPNTLYHLILMAAFVGLYRFDRGVLLNNNPGDKS